MCGIAGEFRFDGRPPLLGTVERITGRLSRRGPDSGGHYAQGAIAFGHRRLKIIDVSNAAQQPMIDSDLGLAIVFNGAIYNYPELRRELEGKGYRFFSRGDTEVIVKAYHAWGVDCVRRFNGMFAFVIWEREGNRIFAARDRLGIKPLYYAEVAGGFRFASALPALLAGGDIDTSLDPIALHHYMSFHSVVPPPYTILKGVRKLPPATVMRIEADGGCHVERYWEPIYETTGADAGHTPEEWEELLLASLRRAVQRRLIADVPVGVLLSGGLDSSLIVGLVAEADLGALKTFSIGFETVGEEEGDEFRYSDIVARHFATDHHQIRIPTERMLAALPDCIAAMSEPMVSHDNVAFYLLAQEVSRHVKVALSGQGADEVFAGYHWYPPLMASNDPVTDYARVFFDRDQDEYAEAVAASHVGADFSRAFVAEHFAKPGAERPIDKALRLDTTVMLVDDPVKRVDNMTMAWGLEARVPFLDHELVELAARIPPELKIRNGGKYILKEAARQIIPAAVIDRPKGYFPVPALKYLRGMTLERVREVLDSRKARERGVFNRRYVDMLLAEPEAHITPLRGSKLWQVALLEMWLQTHDL